VFCGLSCNSDKHSSVELNGAFSVIISFCYTHKFVEKCMSHRWQILVELVLGKSLYNKIIFCCHVARGSGTEREVQLYFFPAAPRPPQTVPNQPRIVKISVYASDSSDPKKYKYSASAQNPGFSYKEETNEAFYLYTR